MEVDQDSNLPTNMNDFDQQPRSPPVQPDEDTPVLNAAGRIVRKRRPTWKILERLPAPPTPVPDPQTVSSEPAPSTTPSIIPPVVWKTVHTIRNAFGLYREFPTLPTHNPDDILTLNNLTESQPPLTVLDAPAPVSRLSVPLPVSGSPADAPYGPFANSSIFGLMNWMWTGSAMKSLAEVTRLFRFLQSDDFKKEDIMGVDFVKETAKLDKYMGFQPNDGPSEDDVHMPRDGWHESDITIQVPDGQKHAAVYDIPTFTIPGLHHRSITAVIRSVFEDPASRCFHYTPFKSFWKSSDTSPLQRVYDELYSSDAMIDAHMELQQSPPEPGCELERVVASLMLWSDSTHLANFGTASLWPLYLFFGNQSKWLRGKPRTASCHHLAYIPKVFGLFFCLVRIANIHSFYSCHLTFMTFLWN